ncbi:putative CDP-diacylglycerol-glycerol-3-phosphate 3-phosphatidyl-transferase 2 [Hartmannibacter diazotrophicus]|uniref:CDP-diacylglycerol--glycerol-3-phosphate 3-phosphatidyltransferase n=1 Tax=Hartmannibacter diazotrophicus TaxID=1482074 RepID=A0A2C9D9A9_9HYPH|nr:CDP-alcohol phosphatidyltransferase family protein [Hartmannibacter diazotrophicus]SON56321.1 putative CDP-diacylglycerol-glycerol-3-phosphate 3-phosphatidyl-transferase 2 [Hartmannibacter diazotrophicus]
MTIPNIITILRLVAVPAFILLMLDRDFHLAMLFFVVAGVSDGIDGAIARHFNQTSELGAYLDPVADKSLLLSAFGTLGLVGVIPAWLVVLVFSRDVLIVGGVVLAWLMDRPVAIEPIMVSKVNTVAQIGYVTLVLAGLADYWSVPGLIDFGAILVSVLTMASAGAYLVSWMRHMAEPS